MSNSLDTNNIPLSEQFQNPIKKLHKEGKCKIDTLNTQIYVHLLFWPDTDISIKSGGNKLDLIVRTS
jgi:hypothetical protein